MQKDLSEIISIKSVRSNPKPNAPFGDDLRQALDWFIDKMRSYGFDSNENDGYCGWADYHGDTEDIIGVLCHLDVVPAGNGWVTPPFTLNEIDGMLYGRGVVDNKGPLVACMHALKRLKSEGFRPKRGIRLIVGCNEENGSSCIKHYVQHEKIPSMSFVPDSDFPLINSEKGILQLKLTIPIDKFTADNLVCVEGGERPNVVPDLCKAIIKKSSPLYDCIMSKYSDDLSHLFRSYPFVNNIVGDGYAMNDFSIEDTLDGLVIEAKGIAGHAMCPDKADNAVWKIFSFIDAAREICGFDKVSIDATDFMYEYLATRLSAAKLGIAAQDDKSGDLTINVGQVKLNDSGYSVVLDLRVPLSMPIKTIEDNILSHAPTDSKLTTLHYAPNLYVDSNSVLVKTLLDAYTTCTGDSPRVIISGGGTYARELPNAVAFGPTFDGITTNIHNADEAYSVENFYKIADIYYEAMKKLANA